MPSCKKYERYTYSRRVLERTHFPQQKITPTSKRCRGFVYEIRLLILSVVGILAMLTQIMLIEKSLLHAGGIANQQAAV